MGAPVTGAASGALVASTGSTTSRLRPTPSSLPPAEEDEEPEPRNTRLIVMIAALVVLLLAGGGYYYYANYYKKGQESGSTKGAAPNAGKPAAAAQPVYPELAPWPDTAPPQATDAERMHEFIRLAKEKMDELKNEHLQSFKEGGFSSLLNPPQRVADDKGFLETRTMLAKMNKLANDNRDRANRLLDSLPGRIDALNQKKKFDEAVLRNGREEINRLSGLYRERWNLEAAATDYLTDIVNLLQGTRDHWSIEEGKFKFERAVDLDRFNDVMNRIKDRIQRQEDIQKELGKEGDSGKITNVTS